MEPGTMNRVEQGVMPRTGVAGTFTKAELTAGAAVIFSGFVPLNMWGNSA
jgi:hypothetical protein